LARTVLAGTRIRDIRTAKRLKQVDLAKACDISPSYLNLIEHNRRRIGGALLLKIAAVLDVDASNVSEGAEAALTTALEGAAEAAEAANAEVERIEELTSRFPGWSRLVAEQYAKVRRLEQVVERLGDRLTHDPYLSASMHNVLSSVTAIRSASAILASGEKVEPEWQSRFHRNIYEDSQRLAGATEILVSYLDAETDTNSDGTLPQEDLDRWLAEQNHQFDVLERNPEASLDEIIAASDGLDSGAAKDLARRYLMQYAADLRVAPRDDLLRGLSAGASPGALAAEIGAQLPVVFRRLASLAPDDLPKGHSEYGLVGCDGSGTLIHRKPIEGFEVPRYSGACPLWPLFQALSQPTVLISSNVAIAARDEKKFHTWAVSEASYPMGYDRPPAVTAWMLFQQRAPGDAAEPERRIGTTCRVCAEQNCAMRREASVISSVLGELL